MAVAPSYQSYEIVTEPYQENGKWYVNIKHPNTGNVRKARWYESSDHDSGTAIKHNAYGRHLKGVLGFSNGPIQIFRGDVQSVEDWFKDSICRYHKLWGWYLASEDAANLTSFPFGIEPIELHWEKVSKDDDTLLSESQILEIVNALIYPDDQKDWVGTVGERIEEELMVIKAIEKFTGYGKTTFHIFNDKNNNVYIWNTSAKSLPEGEWFKVRGTLKELTFYKGQKQNVLTRCVVSEVKNG